MLYPVRAEALSGRTIRFIASTENVCRDRGIVETKGWDTAQFAKNPVFLWCHDSQGIPLGRVSKTEVTPEALIATVEFAGEAEKNDRAECVYRMFKSGFLSAVSVGFNVVERRAPTTEERTAGAEWVATRAELLEISAVPVPADPDALAISRSVAEGTIREAEARYMRSLAEIEGWKKSAKAVEEALAAKPPATQTTSVEVVTAPVVRVDPVPPEPIEETPEAPEPPAEQDVALECAGCGTHFSYCPSCGASFESDSPAPPKTAPAEKSVSNKDNASADGTEAAGNARTAGDEGGPSKSSDAEWWARVGALLEEKKN